MIKFRSCIIFFTLLLASCAPPTSNEITIPPDQPTLTPAPTIPGNTYYISVSTGSDDWPGTEAQPWQTLGKISSMTFQPYDQILLKRGDVWEGEELVLNGSGEFTEDSWITLGTFGEGPKPRITNPPFDETINIEESWSAINAAYPENNREFMKIAVRVDGDGWFITGLEIDNTEIGIYIPGSGARYWVEDMYFHDVLGLFMAVPPGYEESCESALGCQVWSPYPTPAWGSAILINTADYVTVRDVTVERATGGIDGYANVAFIENVFINGVTSGGLNLNGHNITFRYATVLNGQWPDGNVWYGADPFISINDSGWVVERSEVAYTTNGNGGQDAAPVDFDLDSINSAMRDNFFHNNDYPCFEFNMGGGGNRNIMIANNICYNNGLDNGAPTVAFSLDACGYHRNQLYIIQDNVIYKAFPGQYLNFYFHLYDGSPESGVADDFSPGEQACGHIVSNNTVYEYGEYSLPLPAPQPPPIIQENIAPSADLAVSSGSDSAYFAQDGSLDTEWVSIEAQPWIRYEWHSPQTIDTVRLFDRPDLENWATSGVLTFSDGSSVNVTGGILNNGAMLEVVFDSPKTVTWIQFTVTRNVPENPGTNVGLSELQVYLAAISQPPASAPDPGTFTVDFSDQPESPTELMGQYPASVNGIDWTSAGWTTAVDPSNGNRYAFVDMPRWGENYPRGRYTIFILPPGKVLQSVGVACPEGATVAMSQGRNGIVFPCSGVLFAQATGWTAPVSTNIVSAWIDVSATSANLNDVWFDDFVYGD